MRDYRKNNKRQISGKPYAESAFEQVKQHLTNAALLYHPPHDAKTRLVTDASNFGMGASLEQWLDNY